MRHGVLVILGLLLGCAETPDLGTAAPVSTVDTLRISDTLRVVETIQNSDTIRDTIWVADTVGSVKQPTPVVQPFRYYKVVITEIRSFCSCSSDEYRYSMGLNGFTLNHKSGGAQYPRIVSCDSSAILSHSWSDVIVGQWLLPWWVCFDADSSQMFSQLGFIAYSQRSMPSKIQVLGSNNQNDWRTLADTSFNSYSCSSSCAEWKLNLHY
jgi:hypothetical protein